ncbi:hypothetical protein HW273_05715 [Oribacterium sp. oral taxon 102]|uniref:hypothetical protein n=1 Tax=Oribacterium sp. oral taxon 102 TaxID=671214 RepID=UPI0015B96E4A|nr:hypothetical protein [Oribacterium sp. oral taxon 102]NWO21391.1 hypothetical protein [Oribacterium sp. oral taxon 102]
MDNYVEHLVKRKDPGYFMILKLLCIVLDIFGILAAFRFVPGLLLLLLAGILSYFVWLYASVEYEYLYMAGNFTVDMVLNRSRRRKKLETNAEELILIAPKSSSTARDALRSPCRVMDLSGNGPENLKYAYIFSRGGEKQCCYIEMTDKLLRELRFHSPSKVKMQ